MLRVIHTADWQIGREFGLFADDDAAALAAARLTTVKKIGQLATERGADLVLVAGDVFDAPSMADKTMRRLFGALESFQGPWVLLAGNHDPALSAGVWARANELGCIPDNVVVPAAVTTINLNAIGASVLAAPLTQRRVYDDLTAAFETMETPAGHYRLGLAHGSVTGQLQELADAGNPIAADRPETARLDYLALGDWHGKLQIGPRLWYAGTPEQDRFRANEPGYVLQVTLQAPGAVPEVEPVWVGQFRWHDLEVRLIDDSSLDQLDTQLQALDGHAVVRLTLSGQLSLQQQQRLHVLIDTHSARLRALRVDRGDLVTAATDADIADLQADGYLAQVLADLRDPDLDLNTEVREQALQLLANTLMQRHGGSGS